VVVVVVVVVVVMMVVVMMVVVMIGMTMIKINVGIDIRIYNLKSISGYSSILQTLLGPLLQY
jgi:hypothetical protein